MSHFKEVCRECGKIVKQCRCPSQDKYTTYTTCEECKKKNELKHSMEKP